MWSKHTSQDGQFPARSCGPNIRHKMDSFQHGLAEIMRLTCLDADCANLLDENINTAKKNRSFITLK
jgi:hypothetical protein